MTIFCSSGSALSIYLDLVENHRSDLLLDIVKKGYDVYSGLGIGAIFPTKVMGRGAFHDYKETGGIQKEKMKLIS